jgi:hypothetical protein
MIFLVGKELCKTSSGLSTLFLPSRSQLLHSRLVELAIVSAMIIVIQQSSVRDIKIAEYPLFFQAV